MATTTADRTSVKLRADALARLKEAQSILMVGGLGALDPDLREEFDVSEPFAASNVIRVALEQFIATIDKRPARKGASR